MGACSPTLQLALSFMKQIVEIKYSRKDKSILGVALSVGVGVGK